MTRRAWALCALAMWAGAACAADDCGAALNVARPTLAEAGGARIAFASRSVPIPVGRHFDLDFVVCGVTVRSGAAPAVDADMPAHRHGMNYRTRVEALAGQAYRAHGLMFHMPGTWRVMFDLPLEGRTLRVTHEIEVR